MRSLWPLLALLGSTVSFGQISGEFSLPKSIYAPGEPVFLSFTVHNSGTKAVQVQSANPYSSCSGVKIRITQNEHPAPDCYSKSFAISCLSGAITLAAGSSHVDRILLNFENRSEGELRPAIRLPGTYTVEASGAVPWGVDVHNLPDGSLNVEAKRVFQVRVDERLKLPPETYEIYVARLKSPDDEVKREAARTLATIAPPELERLLFTFATSKDATIRRFAPLALINLSTPASLSALARLAAEGEPGTYESVTAAQGLGRTHDPAWFPVLLYIGNQHQAISSYLGYAAESGGEAAIPTLLGHIRSGDANMRRSAVYALGFTGSRSAVPLLISMLPAQALNDKDDLTVDLAATANGALQQLTHRYIRMGSGRETIKSWRGRWERWWLSEGANAAIYRSGECVADTELP